MEHSERREMIMKKLSVLFLMSMFLPAVFAADEFGTKNDVMPTGDAMAVKGNILFATSGSASYSKNKKLTTIDIQSPPSPKILSSVELKGFPQDITIGGNTAFVVDGLRLFAIDISDPGKMRLISETQIADSPEFGPQGLELNGKTLYLAARKSGILAYDVSDAASPKKMTQVRTPFARSVTICGKWIISADDTVGVTVSDGEKIVSTKSLPSGTAARVRTDGQRIIVANGTGCLTVLTISEKGVLSEYASMDSMRDASFYGSYCYDAVPDSGDILLAGGENGILRIDISSPKTPACTDRSWALYYPVIKTMLRHNDTIYASDNGSIIHVFDAPKGKPMKLIGEGIRLK